MKKSYVYTQWTQLTRGESIEYNYEQLSLNYLKVEFHRLQVSIEPGGLVLSVRRWLWRNIVITLHVH